MSKIILFSFFSDSGVASRGEKFEQKELSHFRETWVEPSEKFRIQKNYELRIKMDPKKV